MKPLATLAAASVFALGTAAAVAQSGQTPPAAPPGAPADQQSQGRGDRGPGLSRTELDALTNARIAGIKAGLNLTAEQQRLFIPVEDALRTMAAERATRMEQWREMRRGDRQGQSGQDRPDLSQRLERQAERATRSAQALTTLSNAMKPFYASLDEGQKRLLPILMRPHGGERRMAMRGGYHGDHHGRMERGMMGNQGGQRP